MADTTDRSPRPTKALVFELLEQRRSELAAMHRRMEVADEWIHADEEPSPILRYINKGFPADFDFDIFPYGWTVLNRGTNQVFTAEVPQVSYELPAADKKRAPGWAEDEKAVQLALQGILYKAVTRATENPLLDALQQQLGLGQGVLSYALDYAALGTPPDHRKGTPEEIEAWDAYERRRADVLPWRIDSLHPTWVFFDTSSDPPQNYIIERPVNLADMARRFPKLGLDPASAGNAGETPTATYVEYCDPHWYACYVNGEPVTEGGDEEGVAENTLGHVWLQIAWSGFGKKDRYGRWDRRGVGLVQRGIATFRSLTYNKNWLKLIKQLAVPSYLAQADTAEEAAEEVADFDPTKPNIKALSSRVTLRPLEMHQIPAALLADIQQEEQRLEQLYGPGILSGQDSSGSEPASKWAARTEAARGPYRAPKKNIEQAIANMLSDMLWDIKYEPDFGDGYRVAWEQGKGNLKRRYSVHLKPEQVHPGGKITVDLSPMSAEERAAKVEEARLKQEAGWYSQERAMQEGGEVEDVEEELARMVAERYLQSDQYLMRFDAAVGPQLDALFGVLPAAPAPAPAPAPAAPMPGAPMPMPMPMPGGGEMPGMPLPPGQPQDLGPLPGGDLAAMEDMQTVYRTGGGFQPPQRANGRGY